MLQDRAINSVGLSRAGGSHAWLPDSRRLLYSGSGHLMVLDVQTGSERRLVPMDRQFDEWGRTITLSKDGRALVYLQSQSEGDIWVMTLADPRP